MDASRAHFHAKALRDIYIELPPEEHEEGYCAKLNKAMYGTQDAAAAWEAFYVEVLVERMGFVRGLYNPCLF